MGKLLFEEETYKIRGACFEVYKEKGSGYLESVVNLGFLQVPHGLQPFDDFRAEISSFRPFRLR